MFGNLIIASKRLIEPVFLLSIADKRPESLTARVLEGQSLDDVFVGTWFFSARRAPREYQVWRGNRFK